MLYWTTFEIYNLICFVIGVVMALAAIRGLSAHF